MRLECYEKEDICKPIEIPNEHWKETLQRFIIASVQNQEHLGKNLKQQCLDYLEELFKEKE